MSPTDPADRDPGERPRGEPHPPPGSPRSTASGSPTLPEEAIDDGEPAPPDALDIPMLTDVVRVSRYAASELPASLDQPDWSDLSRRIQDNVMQRLLRRTEAMLDGPLQQALDQVLERHLHAMHRDLSDAMSRILRELVARAVADELARVHAEIASRGPTRPESPVTRATTQHAPGQGSDPAGMGPDSSGADTPPVLPSLRRTR